MTSREMRATDPSSTRLLAAFSAAYCLASFVHFVHNAEYLADYPNMPLWISRAKVYAAWLAITAVGALGLVVARSRHAIAGFVLVALYAVLGFDGLGHYALAPLSSHSLAMNFTIWFEVAAAAVLLCIALRCVFLAGRRFGAAHVDG